MFSVAAEFEHRSDTGKGLLPGGHGREPLTLADGFRELLAVDLAQLGLEIKRVDVRWAACHEEVDHSLGLWGKVWEVR